MADKMAKENLKKDGVQFGSDSRQSFIRQEVIPKGEQGADGSSLQRKAWIVTVEMYFLVNHSCSAAILFYYGTQNTG